MKRTAFILAALLAACTPGPQQSELQPAAPVITPEPLPEVPAPEVSTPEASASEPSVVVVPAEPTEPADAPAAPESGGASSGGASAGEAAAPTSVPEGTLSISADNQTFVTNVAGEVTPVTVTAGGTFYLRLEFTDPDGVSAAQVELRNTDDPGTLPRGPFSIASSDCEAALASAPTELTCTVAVTVAPDAQNIAQAGEVAYAFRPLVTDAAGNGDLALSWGYLVVQPQ